MYNANKIYVHSDGFLCSISLMFIYNNIYKIKIIVINNND